MSGIPAGRFSVWLQATEAANASGAADAGVDVPCGSCTACCRSSYFIHIGREERRTLRRVPAELLFPAPGMPKGNKVMGYDDDGRCPMLVDDRCSIYEDRPRACRTYDCRVFAATGLSPLDDGKVDVAERVGRWRFAIDTDVDARAFAAVRAAAAFLRDHPECFDDGRAPASTGQLALMAVKVHRLFAGPAGPDVAEVRGALGM